MLIDDKYIKKEVSVYQMTRSSISLNKVIDTLSSYIYHYPRKIFLLDHDKAIDFYIYYIERIDKIILSYKNMNDIKFITWFTYTLRSHYLNYVDMIKRRNKFLKKEISFDSSFYDNSLVLYDVIAYEDNSSSSEELKNITELILKNIRLKYKERDVFVFTIHYLELFMSHIINIIVEYLSVDYEEACNIVEKARSTYIRKYNDIIVQQDRITNINMKIDVNRKQSKSCENLMNKKRLYMKRLSAIKLLVPHTFIACLINTTKNTITKIINKVKSELKQMHIKF